MKIGTSDVSKLYVGSAEVDKVYLGTDLVYSGGTPPQPHDYSQDYLTFVALEDGTFKFSGNSINYSVDDGQTWTALASNTNSPTVTAGNKILWKTSGLTIGGHGIGKFISTGKFDVEGNIMSIASGDSFVSATTIVSNQFKKLFLGNTNIVSAENLVLPVMRMDSNCYSYMFAGCTSLTTVPQLPATTLGGWCYAYMFQNCTSLTTAPVLPATTLTEQCYRGMFENCTSLTTSPQLPATTLASSCYYYMFNGCTSLATAPELPATTLVNSCYFGIFSGCTNLNSITCLATDISATKCTQNWVRNVAATGTFTKAASMTGWPTGDGGIPTNWTVQDFQ